MKWIINFFTSSLGRKLIMSLTGLFLILFLIVHLFGNLKLLADDGGKSFTDFVIFMEENPLVKITAWGLYIFILLHAIQGTIIWIINRKTKGRTYAVTTSANASWASKNMFYLGVLIFVFLIIHMGDWWLELKMLHKYDDEALYQNVIDTFKMPLYVVIYDISMIALFFHLKHGFQSAFQTLGVNHKKYTPIIQGLGWIYSIAIPLGFFIIPIYIYFFK
jgi:succinate dehydrogenase / fumarate reductase cytochrome b subunit